MIVHVSDHALDRFCLRVGSNGLQREELRRLIARLVEPAASVRAGRYTVEGVTFCMSYNDNGFLVTVTTVFDSAANNRDRRKRERRRNTSFPLMRFT